MNTFYIPSITLPSFDPRNCTPFDPRFTRGDCAPYGFANYSSIGQKIVIKIDYFGLHKQRAALSYIPGAKDNVYASRSVSIFPKAVYAWYLCVGGDCDIYRANGPTWTVNVNGTVYKYNIPPYYIDYYIYKYVSTETNNYIFALPKDIKHIIQQYFVAPRQLDYNLYK